MKIIVDVDVTTADFISAVQNILDETDRSTASEYNWYDEHPRGKIVRAAMEGYAFWRHMELIENAVEGIQFLRSQGHKILWVTAPYKQCKEWYKAREEWLEENFKISSYQEPYIPIREKYYIRADIMIDDNIEWIKEWENNNPKGIGFIFKSELHQHYKETYTWKDIMSMSFFKSKK